MKALWTHNDLPRRHLHLVSTSERRPAAKTDGARVQAGRHSGAEASPESLPRLGAQLTVEDLTDLEQLAIVAARMEDATNTLKTAVKRRNLGDAQTAARAVLHIGLLAGDRSRAIEARARG